MHTSIVMIINIIVIITYFLAKGDKTEASRKDYERLRRSESEEEKLQRYKQIYGRKNEINLEKNKEENKEKSIDNFFKNGGVIEGMIPQFENKLSIIREKYSFVDDKSRVLHIVGVYNIISLNNVKTKYINNYKVKISNAILEKGKKYQIRGVVHGDTLYVLEINSVFIIGCDKTIKFDEYIFEDTFLTPVFVQSIENFKNSFKPIDAEFRDKKELILSNYPFLKNYFVNIGTLEGIYVRIRFKEKIHYFLQGVKIIMPEDISLKDTGKIKVKGILFEDTIYVVELDSEFILTEKIENKIGKSRYLSREEIYGLKKEISWDIILGIILSFMLIGLENDYKIILGVTLAFVIMYCIDIYKKKEIKVYSLEGIVDIVREDYVIDGVKIKNSFDESNLKIGEYVKVEGTIDKVKNKFQIIPSRGGNLFIEYNRKAKSRLYFSILLILALFSIAFFKCKEFDIDEYNQSKKFKNYTSTFDSINSLKIYEPVAGQYMDLSNFKYISKLNDDNLYYIVDENYMLPKGINDKYEKTLEKYNYFRSFLEDIDDNLSNSNDKRYKNNKNYQALKKAYISETYTTSELVKLYDIFREEYTGEIMNEFYQINESLIKTLEGNPVIAIEGKKKINIDDANRFYIKLLEEESIVGAVKLDKMKGNYKISKEYQGKSIIEFNAETIDYSIRFYKNLGYILSAVIIAIAGVILLVDSFIYRSKVTEGKYQISLP